MSTNAESQEQKKPPEELTQAAKVTTHPIRELRLADVECPNCKSKLAVYTDLDKLVAEHGPILEETLGLRS